jgi:hypothetical protein
MTNEVGVIHSDLNSKVHRCIQYMSVINQRPYTAVEIVAVKCTRPIKTIKNHEAF